jgi:predicted AlkP superfamily pyrophosphatase or phosphodiesterase
MVVAPSPFAFAQPTWQEPPRLVVGIVVDQMRTDHLYRYWDTYGEHGFKRLVQGGAFLRDAHFGHMPTLTGVDHATIYTGAPPAHHGIVANDMFVRSTGTTLYCAQDNRVKGVGCEGATGQRSPANLLATTIADELERRYDRASKTIGIAMKDRGSILPIGRTGDAAYWFSADSIGRWCTSTWYMDRLPRWVEDFNQEGRPAKYLKNTWDLLLPRERYRTPLPDDNPYENALHGATTTAMPYDLARMSAIPGVGTALISYTPWGNTLTTDFALAAIKGESLGADAIPDLLAISYSPPDHLGHRLGIRSLEMHDMYVRLDAEIARLLTALDEQVGPGRWTAFLTSDHGVVDVPQYLKDLKGSAGYVDPKLVSTDVDIILGQRFGTGKWVRYMDDGALFLNDSLIAARKADRAAVQRAAADALLRNPLFAEALTATDLAREAYPTGIRALMQRGFMPQRSGDVLYVLRPGHLEASTIALKKGTHHFTPWNYDTHVPVVFYGRGIAPGEVLRRTSVMDIAPTLSMLLGTALPDASTGTVVHEALR